MGCYWCEKLGVDWLVGRMGSYGIVFEGIVWW